MADMEEFRQQFYAYVKETADQWRATQEQIQAEIVEHKKTINNAVSLLAKEFFDFQTKDIAERKLRQKRADIKDVCIAAIGCLAVLSACGVMAVLLYLLYQVSVVGGTGG